MSKIRIFSLGGLNENGKNMYVIEVDNDIFVFDAGLKYADDKLFGIDYILPNYDYIKENINRVKGIFLTHGHNENMGGVPDIVSELPNIKVYGAKFTLEVLKRELESCEVKFNNFVEIKAHKKINFGENSIFPVSVTHSIPDSLGYVLNTKDGAIVYTGDFVFDPTMMGPYKTDIGKLAYIGKQGVLCLLTESMYAEKKGHTSPYHRTAKNIREILTRNENRIIYNVFSAHIYNIQELFNEVEKTNRKIVIMGKTLQNIINNALDMHYLEFDKKRIGDLSNINDRDVIILVSNEKEKSFSNINRMINGYDKYIKIKDTDTIVFGEPITDNFEKSAVKAADQLAKIGANVIMFSTNKQLLHHASSEDLMLMINLFNPKYYFPVKGEYRFQVANANVATEVGIKPENILLKQNGEVVEFIDGNLVECFDKIKTEDILIDGNVVSDVGEAVLKDREVLSENGIVIISTTLDKKTKKIISGPEVITRGFVYVKDSTELLEEIKKLCINIINSNIDNPKYIEYNKLKSLMRENLGKYLYKETECKPMIITVFQEV
ncbi:MAG: ribonuclease J [Bacilli bacterium]|nr:ribonuclease J [Bacilli bacterium]